MRKLPRAITALTSISLASTCFAQETMTLSIEADQSGPTIRPEIYGHFAEHLGACIYGGIWVGEDSDIPNTRGIRNDVVEALKQLDIPVLRWPGGCFADEYHWKDGIGPRSERKPMINTHWGRVVENNHFGTHEFFDLVEMLGTKAYISGNVGSGTVQEMMEWVEYITSAADSPLANLRRANGREEPWELPYFGVGNESWGCGGNMRPEYYADLYRQYNTFVKNYDGNQVYRIACGSNGDDRNWTTTLMDRAARHMDGLSLHYYTLPTGNWSDKGPATGFGEGEYHATLVNGFHVRDVIAAHAEIMDTFDPERRVGMIIDEWGVWTNVEPGTNPGFLYQQNSLRDAIVAAIHFNIFHEFAERIHMANIAQTVNVLQAMILTDGPRMLRTPTYWVFDMYKVHQGATVIPLKFDPGEYEVDGKSVPRVSATASRPEDGDKINISLVNTHPTEAVTISCPIQGTRYASVSGRILTADAVDAHNTFDKPDQVSPKPFNNAKLSNNQLQVILPPKSIVALVLE